MFVDEGDELLVGNSEYIVLKKYTDDGREYVFVADSKAPEVNIAENFDLDAIKLLMLSQEANGTIVGNTNNNEYIPQVEVNDSNNKAMFKVEKEENLIQKILSFMFMG